MIQNGNKLIKLNYSEQDNVLEDPEPISASVPRRTTRSGRDDISQLVV